MLRVLAHVAVLASAIGVTTAWLGWWSVPMVAFVYGAVSRNVRARWAIAGASAVIAWADLLALMDIRGAHVGAISARVASVVGMPAAALVAVTLVFAALLAAPAAVLGCAFWSRLRVPE
ncbi:MAG TPA: hypothetical protein VGT98_13385 [Candidatus Elarobacter sp.]|nr:hypothetical protein [Candidatus Elarobacter sp.]